MMIFSFSNFMPRSRLALSARVLTMLATSMLLISGCADKDSSEQPAQAENEAGQAAPATTTEESLPATQISDDGSSDDVTIADKSTGTDRATGLAGIKSPDGRIHFKTWVDENGNPYYAVDFNNEPVIKDSRHKNAKLQQRIQLIANMRADAA